MKRLKFTDSQFITILKQNKAGIELLIFLRNICPIKESVENTYILSILIFQ